MQFRTAARNRERCDISPSRLDSPNIVKIRWEASYYRKPWIDET
jgi:hypothetical protein